MFDDKEYIKSRSATHTPWVLVDAIHAAKPNSDLHTGIIASKVAEITGCHCIIATVSRNVADLNRPHSTKNKKAIREYRDCINYMLETSRLLRGEKLAYPFLHLAIHGMKDREDKDIELGTRHGRSCSPLIQTWIYKQFVEISDSLFWKELSPAIVLDEHFIGDSSKEAHRHGDQNSLYSGYGENFNTVQIECAHWLRTNHPQEIIDTLCQIIGHFRRDFCREQNR